MRTVSELICFEDRLVLLRADGQFAYQLYSGEVAYRLLDVLAFPPMQKRLHQQALDGRIGNVDLTN
ncbi:MAG: hypothetical protein HY820_21615 [Acidobacteria bacterium]|nr:hypothetical protein [Acidobacteriota bacterium]